MKPQPISKTTELASLTQEAHNTIAKVSVCLVKIPYHIIRNGSPLPFSFFEL